MREGEGHEGRGGEGEGKGRIPLSRSTVIGHRVMH